VYVLATCGMPVSVGQFLAIGVTPVTLRLLITMGNLGAWLRNQVVNSLV
jgi:hypothetical protein